MDPIPVPTRLSLCTTYTFHAATSRPVSDGVIVLHHGICHTRVHFEKLISELNEKGFHCAMVDQQSENAPLRNCIGPRSYRRGMEAAVLAIKAATGRDVIGYVLHSMGAMIGEEMQQSRPKLRRPTVLMAPIPVHGALPVSVKLFFNDPLAYLWAVATCNIKALAATERQVKTLFFDTDTDDKTVEKAKEALKHAPFWMYCRLILRPLIFWRWIWNDGNAKLLVTSKTDFLFAHCCAYTLTKWFYRPQVEDVERGGHDFFIEQADDVAAKIATFVTDALSSGVVPKHHMDMGSKESLQAETKNRPKVDGKGR